MISAFNLAPYTSDSEAPTRNPVRPSSITSGIPAVGAASTTVPDACASRMTSGSPSWVEGSRRKSDARSSASTSLLIPRKLTYLGDARFARQHLQTLRVVANGLPLLPGQPQQRFVAASNERRHRQDCRFLSLVFRQVCRHQDNGPIRIDPEGALRRAVVAGRKSRRIHGIADGDDAGAACAVGPGQLLNAATDEVGADDDEVRRRRQPPDQLVVAVVQVDVQHPLAARQQQGWPERAIHDWRVHVGNPWDDAAPSCATQRRWRQRSDRCSWKGAPDSLRLKGQAEHRASRARCRRLQAPVSCSTRVVRPISGRESRWRLSRRHPAWARPAPADTSPPRDAARQTRYIHYGHDRP